VLTDWAGLPGLTRAANIRIRSAKGRATDLLLTGVREAFERFLDIEGSARTRNTKTTARIAALHEAQRNYRNAMIAACQFLFDAVAAEYLGVESNPQLYSERLKLFVLPFVRRSLPIANDDRWILSAIHSSLMQWENQRAGLSDIPRLRKTTMFARDTPAEVIDRLRREHGWTVEALAEHAGLDIKPIYRLKRGEPVHSNTIAKVAAALGCQPGDLVPPVKRERGRQNRSILPS
jgi:DNA-binding Xre family transcriptional regulator